ncbi:unnamed protein product [Parascedosporium putredinis]|uniref:Uncharacterized protein n=1 Tax=Parascedosporium putredinis TaxID=1442378 RepID=A0A9P1M8T6_9PEZI|nr:unnamed protein product [Parascedosporium putredinis]CAI7994228.1 unnamed protein product [Parascedosporium putredinis]
MALRCQTFIAYYKDSHPSDAATNIAVKKILGSIEFDMKQRDSEYIIYTEKKLPAATVERLRQAINGNM